MLFEPQSGIGICACMFIYVCKYIYVGTYFILCALLNHGSIYKGSFLLMGCDVPPGGSGGVVSEGWVHCVIRPLPLVIVILGKVVRAEVKLSGFIFIIYQLGFCFCIPSTCVPLFRVLFHPCMSIPVAILGG